MLNHVIGGLWKKGAITNVRNIIRHSPCTYVPANGFRVDKAPPKSFFGVADYMDDENSRPFRYQKERRVTNLNRNLPFNRRTGMYMYPYTLEVTILRRSARVSLTHRMTSMAVAAASTSSKDFKQSHASTIDVPACRELGRLLACRAKEADVYIVYYTPREREKFEGRIRAVVQSIIDNGIDVKVYL